MGSFSVNLFDWLQNADFYRALHQKAVDQLPPGTGQTWLDVGCGPGLLTRLAVERKYNATGTDRDAKMIERAQLNDIMHQTRYVVSDLNDSNMAPESFDVVSASSLVVVTENPHSTMESLAQLVKPGGHLLIIEASRGMSLVKALRAVIQGGLGRRSYMLLLWAAGRAGNVISDDLLALPGWGSKRFPLIDGQVNVWLLSKPIRFDDLD